MIISKKRYDKEMKTGAKDLYRLYVLKKTILEHERTIQKILVMIQEMQEALNSQKGKIKGYYERNGEVTICENENT